jgi:hypothetical protein
MRATLEFSSKAEMLDAPNMFSAKLAISTVDGIL